MALPFMRISPAVGSNQSVHAVEQNRLAALARTENDQEFVFIDLQRDLVQHMQQLLLAGYVEGLGDVHAFYFDAPLLHTISLLQGQSRRSAQRNVAASREPTMPIRTMPTRIMDDLLRSMP